MSTRSARVSTKTGGGPAPRQSASGVRVPHGRRRQGAEEICRNASEALARKAHQNCTFRGDPMADATLAAVSLGTCRVARTDRLPCPMATGGLPIGVAAVAHPTA
jgi:hypothetical protein